MAQKYKYIGSGGYSIVVLNKKTNKVLKIIKQDQLDKKFKVEDMIDELLAS